MVSRKSRRYVLIEGASRKFWEISLTGKAVETRFGRIGTEGQVSRRTAWSPKAALATYETLVREKTGKGYTPEDGGIVLPPLITRLLTAPAAIVDAVPGLGGADDALLALADADWRTAAEAGELGYTGWPFEVVPFAWQGGDGLVYALLVHDARFALRCPVVSYAPVDDGGPVWLGDDAKEALANLMAVGVRDASWGVEDPEECRAVVAEARARARDFGRFFAITPTKDVSHLTRGARGRRSPEVEVPRGYRWLPTARNMGVLAPLERFDRKLGRTHGLKPFPEAGSELTRAREALRRSFSGSALAIARNVYACAHGEDNLEAAKVMRDAYEALGRRFLVARAEAYIAQHARPARRASARSKRRTYKS